MDILNKIDPKIPRDVNPQFSISGPTTGNGLPLAVSLGLTNVGEITVRPSAALTCTLWCFHLAGPGRVVVAADSA